MGLSQTRLGSLARVGPASRVEPNLVAAVIGRIFPRPCCKSRLAVFPSPSDHSLSISVFAVRLIGAAAAHFRSSRCGNRHRQPSPARAGLPQHSFFLPFIVIPAAAFLRRPLRFHQLRARCDNSRRRLGRAVLRQPSSPIDVSQEIHPCTPSMSFPCPHHAAAGHPCIRHGAGFSSFSSSSRGVHLRLFRPTFPVEEGWTPHSRQQVISSAPGPWALRGIPLRAGWHEH